jgi:AcrR family transcriptional regulator
MLVCTSEVGAADHYFHQAKVCRFPMNLLQQEQKLILTSATTSKTHYHHGNLRASLLAVATAMVEEQGIESLSLRKLADRVGVSRTAPYHHFENKNELLCAIAEQGFQHWLQTIETILKNKDPQPVERYRGFVLAYVKYAVENPEIYDLMFGRTLWKQQAATDSLKSVAYPCFQKQVELVKKWQQDQLIKDDLDTLRLTQVVWSTLHGIARLVIDGIYADTDHVQEMCDMALQAYIKID